MLELIGGILIGVGGTVLVWGATISNELSKTGTAVFASIGLVFVAFGIALASIA